MQEYKLRDYQTESVSRSVDFLKAPHSKNGVVVLPTGSGKSLVIASIIKEIGEPVLVFQPSKEILEQNFDKMKSYGYEPTIYSASKGKKEISEITFATIGSAKSKTELFKHFKYIIIDECHLVNAKGGMYESFISDIGKSKIIGLTATPYRLSTDGYGGAILKFITRTRPRIFSEVVHYVQNSQLFDQGYLAPLKYYKYGKFDRSQVKLNSTGANFDDFSLQRYIQKIDLEGEIVKIVNRCLELGRKNILVFTSFVSEAMHVSRHVENCALVTGETSKSERESIIDGFRNGSIKVVTNAKVLTTGFDYPELETIIIARPTQSLALYYQMIGRAMRPHPNKESSMIIDMCSNIELFGKVEDLTIKTVDGREKWYVSRGDGKQLTNVYLKELGSSI